MDDPAAFLKARLDEDEAAAKAAGGDSWSATESGVYHEDAANFPGPFAVGPYEYLEDEERAHIGRHDPARVLREVAAKRAILDEWEDADRHRYNLPEGVSEGRDDDERERDDAVADAMDSVIAHLAAVWNGRQKEAT